MLVSLVRTVLILAVIYYVFRLIGRYVLPFFLKRYMKNFQKKFYQQNPHINPDKDKGKEGEVKINHTGKETNKSKNDELGDYVDFEELDDNNK